ncbi:MAG: VanZ family protein [Wujia sp.]
MNRRRIIFLVLSIICMTTIFVFSSRDGDESTEDSYGAGLLVGRIFVPGFEDRSEEEQLQFAEKIDYPVRKFAHVTEYAILAMLISGVTVGLWKKRSKELFVAWLITTAYAGTDEFHQLFVPGRSGKIIDVLIDSSGALIGVLFLCFIIAVRRRVKENRNR